MSYRMPSKWGRDKSRNSGASKVRIHVLINESIPSVMKGKPGKSLSMPTGSTSAGIPLTRASHPQTASYPCLQALRAMISNPPLFRDLGQLRVIEEFSMAGDFEEKYLVPVTSDVRLMS